jgi:ABC-type amino acid transport substrate-binding protein
MADESAAPPATPTTSANRPSFPAYVTGQALWLVPLTLALFAVTVLLVILSPRDGASLATILAFDVTCIGAVVPVLVLGWERSTPTVRAARTGRPRDKRDKLRPAQRRLLWGTAAVSQLAATALVTMATVQAITDDSEQLPPDNAAGLIISDDSPGGASGKACLPPQERNPETYLSGEVVIGIDGHHPGWSMVDDGAGDVPPTGFDVDLAEFLGDEFGFRPVFEELLPVERETALQDCDVDLVISNYSITRPRSNEVDFAGPYFIDESGLLCNDAKIDCNAVVPRDRVCVVEGTIAWENIDEAEEADSIGRCLERFADDDDVVAAYSTDRTILTAYDHYDQTIDASVGTARWQQLPDQAISNERYGIGMPDDSPALCSALVEAVKEFIDSGWEAAFTDNLAASQEPTGHKPTTTDVHCDD